MEQLPITTTFSPYTINEVLHGIIERIEEVRGLEISYVMESAAVISTCHKNN